MQIPTNMTTELPGLSSPTFDGRDFQTVAVKY